MANKKIQQKLVIEFSSEQTKKYFEIVSRKLEGEGDADCFPSGAQIIIDIIPPFGDHAIVNGVDIGEVSLDFISEP